MPILTLMAGGGATFTTAVEVDTCGLLAVIVLPLPAATPVKLNTTEALPCGTVAVAGTVNLVGSLDVRLTVRPPTGAGWLRVIVIGSVRPENKLIGFGASEAVSETVTTLLPLT